MISFNSLIYDVRLTHVLQFVTGKAYNLKVLCSVACVASPSAATASHFVVQQGKPNLPSPDMYRYLHNVNDASDLHRWAACGTQIKSRTSTCACA